MAFIRGRVMLPGKERGGGTMRKLVAALAGAVLAGAGSPASGASAPAPVRLDAQGIDAWRREHIDGDGWTLMHADGAALSYARAGGPDGLQPDKDGVLRIDVRREYYRSVRLGPKASRSNFQAWLVDCEGRRLKVTAMNFYAQNNMKGSGFRKEDLDSSWTAVPAETQDSPLFDRICAAQSPRP
jgi:hypothetical protein